MKGKRSNIAIRALIQSTLSATLLLGSAAQAVDIGVLATKLVVVDKLGAAGKAKTVFVSKDSGVTKGAGLAPELISAELYLQYEDGSAAGAFVVPSGLANGWLVNKETVAKYVNKDAPMGVTQVQVAVIKPSKLLKLVGKGLGDVPFDILNAGEPSLGTVETAYCLTNDGERNCHCSVFTGCAYKSIAAGTGAKLVCRNGAPDAVCSGIEQIPPDTVITEAPGDPTNAIDAMFAFESADPWAIFECQLDGAGFTSCVPGVVYSTLPDGVHTFEVAGIDLAGNVDPTPATYTWTVDTVPPDTFLITTPASLSNDVTPTFAFLAEAGSTFQCRVDAGAYLPCASPTVLPPLADGDHAFEVRAADLAGNVGLPAVYAWTIDTVPPETDLIATPPNPSSDPISTFAFTSEVGSTFQCRVDAGAYAACASPTTLPPLANGVHTFEVRAIDVAGNVDPTPAAYLWTVDTLPPVVTINQAVSQADPTNTQPVVFTVVFNEPVFGFTAADVTVIGTGTISVLNVSVGGGPANYTVTVSLTGSGTVTAQIPAGGAFDAAGNTNSASSSTDNTVVVDTVPPETSITNGPATPTTFVSAQFAFGSNESGTFQCRIDGGSYGACSSPISYIVDRRAHSFQVRAIDAAGNVDPTPATYAWTVAPALLPYASPFYYGNAGGGTAYNDACPTGQALIGFNARINPWFNQIQAVCGTIVVSGGTVLVGSSATLPLRGNSFSGSFISVLCPANRVVVGFRGRAGALIDQLTIRCAALSATPVPGGYNYLVSSFNDVTGGGTGGTAFPQTDCPAGTIATVARIRAGDSVDAFGMTCTF